MMRRPMWIAVCGWGLVCGLAGCGKFGQESPDPDADAVLKEFGDVGESNTSPVGRSGNDAATENLELRLKVGDRFPLIKTVEQRLRTVPANGGAAVESTSQVTMTLAIQLEEITDGVKRLGVRYQRVRYEHDIAGDKVIYDSTIPTGTIPEVAQVYHGLVNNGFSFWLGADNRIVKVEDFEGFLKRCVRNAPLNQQQELLTRLVASQEDEGIANFVDDSVGMLPYNIDADHDGGTVPVGATWRKNLQIMRPIPMTIDTAYRLESLNDRYATIELVGQVGPAKIEHIGSSPTQQVGVTEKLSLRSGHCVGTCMIDRKSGLPIQSRVTRQLEMTLELPSGARFDQRKEIITTMRAFPEQEGAGTVLRRDVPAGSVSTRPESWPSSFRSAAPVAASNGNLGTPFAPTGQSPSPRRDPNVLPAGFER